MTHPHAPPGPDAPPKSDRPSAAPEPRPATLAQVAGAVFWSFFGVRKGRHMQQDAVTIKPLQVVVVGLVAGLLIVLTLVAIVSAIVHGAG